MYTVYYNNKIDDVEGCEASFDDPDRARDYIKAHHDEWSLYYIEKTVTMDTNAFVAGDNTALAGYVRDWDR